jgi:hypothetical protein
MNMNINDEVWRVAPFESRLIETSTVVLQIEGAVGNDIKRRDGDKARTHSHLEMQKCQTV